MPRSPSTSWERSLTCRGFPSRPGERAAQSARAGQEPAAGPGGQIQSLERLSARDGIGGDLPKACPTHSGVASPEPISLRSGRLRPTPWRPQTLRCPEGDLSQCEALAVSSHPKRLHNPSAVITLGRPPTLPSARAFAKPRVVSIPISVSRAMGENGDDPKQRSPHWCPGVDVGFSEALDVDTALPQPGHRLEPHRCGPRQPVKRAHHPLFRVPADSPGTRPTGAGSADRTSLRSIDRPTSSIRRRSI